MTGDQKERGRWMVIRRTSGRVVELSTVFVPANVKPRRNKRRGTTTAQKQDEKAGLCETAGQGNPATSPTEISG